MNKRGFACIGLDKPKFSSNIGEVLRASGCYGADMVAVSGFRYQNSRVDTQKAWKHIPFLEVEDLKSALPKGATPVAVDLIDGAKSLVDFTHPESAFYIFGGEDRTLSEEITSWCKYKIFVPTNHCMNLAATVNVVLYDRMAKRK